MCSGSVPQDRSPVVPFHVGDARPSGVYREKAPAPSAHTPCGQWASAYCAFAESIRHPNQLRGCRFPTLTVRKHVKAPTNPHTHHRAQGRGRTTRARLPCRAHHSLDAAFPLLCTARRIQWQISLTRGEEKALKLLVMGIDGEASA
jgi:hypothetical protein